MNVLTAKYYLGRTFAKVVDSLYLMDGGACAFDSSTRWFAKLKDHDENRFHSHKVKALKMSSYKQATDLARGKHKCDLFLSFQDGYAYYPEKDDPAFTSKMTRGVVKLGEGLSIDQVERVLNSWEGGADISDVLAPLLILSPDADWKADAARFENETIEIKGEVVKPCAPSSQV